MASPRRPPFDPAYKNGGGIPELGETIDIAAVRAISTADEDRTNIETKFPNLTFSDISIPGVPGLSSSPVTVTLCQTSQSPSSKWAKGRPIIVHVHGGGQVMGNRYLGFDSVIAHFAPSDDVVVASVEYRLAPEHPAPAAAHDVYAVLVHLTTHAQELGIDAQKIITYGVSGGAAVAASAALLSRREKGPQCLAQVLSIPMLDDRQELFASAAQFEGGTVWTGKMDRQAWGLVLGDGDRESEDGVRVAGRARDLGGLPPTFIDIGSSETMRDQAVQFASGIWRDGGSAELHVWPGLYHGGAMFEPDVIVSKQMVRAQKAFLDRVLGLAGAEGGEEKVAAVL